MEQLLKPRRIMTAASEKPSTIKTRKYEMRQVRISLQLSERLKGNGVRVKRGLWTDFCHALSIKSFQKCVLIDVQSTL